MTEIPQHIVKKLEELTKDADSVFTEDGENWQIKFNGKVQEGTFSYTAAIEKLHQLQGRK